MILDGPSSETAVVMLDVGIAVNMNWGCAGSGANTQGAVPTAFKQTFGYQDAQYKDIHHISDFTGTINTEIGLNRPVIMRGGRNVNGNYTDGHAWVCDGTWSHYLYDMSNCQIEYQAHQYHMNWGWDGTFNGWYVYQQNPPGHDFTYQRGTVYNITP